MEATDGDRMHGSRSSPGPVLHVHPQSSLNDQDLTIRASGLKPNHLVTLRASVCTESGRYRFESHAWYRADTSGTVDVRRDPSVRGSYTGVEPMGLLWGLEPMGAAVKNGIRLVKKDVTKPFVYTFELVDDRGDALDSVIAERWYLADHVERQLVSHGVANGCLYIPNQDDGSSSRLPVVLDMRGGTTIVVEDRASLLASHGFATFSIDYYHKMAKGEVPIYVDRFFDLQIFLDIYDYIVKHPRLDEHRVAIISSCMGGVLSMQAAARLGRRFPIRCLSVTSCVDFLGFGVGLRMLDGTKIQPYCTLNHYKVTEEPDGSHVCRPLSDLNVFDNLEGDFMTPVEDISCPMLFLINGDDQHLPAKKRMTAMVKKMERVGNGHLVETLHLEGAGHFMDAPYSPHCPKATIDPTLPYPVYSYFGGEKRLHAYALNKAWRKCISWLRGHLGVTEVYREDWLDFPETKKTPAITSRL